MIVTASASASRWRRSTKLFRQAKLCRRAPSLLVLYRVERVRQVKSRLADVLSR